MSYQQWREKYVDKANESGIISSGAISGARNPYSAKSDKHAEIYYASVRKMKTDVDRISKNTGVEREKIQYVKDYIFNTKHNLGGSESEYFEPDFMMAQSWERLILGEDIQKHDMTLLKHEIMEKELVDKGTSQFDAHIITSRKYNYDKEAKEFYANIKKYKNK